MHPYCVYILNSSIWVNELFCFTARKWSRVTDWSLKVQVIKGPFLSHCPTPARTAKARVTLQSQLSWAVQSYDSTALLLSRSLWDLLLFVFGKSGCSKWLLVFWFWHTVHTESACPQLLYLCLCVVIKTATLSHISFRAIHKYMNTLIFIQCPQAESFLVRFRACL